jgi:NAD(P)-dependent dehydrogenase (short-subunit alcohol dehydrogenase family)
VPRSGASDTSTPWSRTRRVHSKPFADYTAADYALVTGVNLVGFLWVTQLAVAEMLRQGHGHVVNISATIADRAVFGTWRCWPH